MSLTRTGKGVSKTPSDSAAETASRSAGMRVVGMMNVLHVVCLTTAVGLAGCERARESVSTATPESAAEPGVQEEIRRLQSLGYTGGSEQPTEHLTGVVVHDPERTTPGPNIIVSGHGHEAYLMDPSGEMLHRWALDVEEAFPEETTSATHFRRVYPYANGDLVVIYGHADGIVKIDRDSNLRWAVFNGAHHDFEVQPNGDICTLVRDAHVMPEVHPTKPILEDSVVILGPDGEEKQRASLVTALMRSEYAMHWATRETRTGDVLHTNSVAVVDFDAPGQVMVSILQLDLVAVLDMERETIVWAHANDFDAQHDAQVLANGNLLLFDNQGGAGPSSRILEIDMETRRTVWAYPADGQPASFYSHTRGTVHRFSNGNTLINETDRGRAFEVTPDGETVWEFYNPFRAGDDGEFIAALLDVWRLPPEFPTDWIDSSTVR